MKLSKRDILGILRQFGQASDKDVASQVDSIKLHNPSPYNTAVGFRFKRRPGYVLFDRDAADDTDYIKQQIMAIDPGFSGEVVSRTDDASEYDLPFKGKSAHLVLPEITTARLDVHLSQLHPEASRSSWQKHIKAGRILVNGEVPSSVRQEVGPKDIIEISLPKPIDKSTQELPIIYIDDDVVVVDKPAGVLTHAKGPLSDEFTVADFFSRYTTYKSDTNRPGVIHRLDRDTSGIIIGARNEETAKRLQKQFSDRTVKKTYVALLEDQPKLDEAVIDLPIGRNPNSPSTFRVDAAGKPAQTTYQVIGSPIGGQTAVRLKPKTGRTHQLRVHMAHINTPIVGDRVYGNAAERLYLHAYQLEVTLAGGKRTVFTAELPSEFSQKHPGIESNL